MVEKSNDVSTHFGSVLFRIIWRIWLITLAVPAEVQGNDSIVLGQLLEDTPVFRL